ncbi:hypothetical protein LCGC14_1516900 [marine sediment metagenome]|uniref:Zinc finger/thioredoxin putative domain-containing protein n=1 Tax=marine sediment metagenome TaxID=412755 RepID=A0A0F9M0X0_9ZZZZ
MVECPACGLPEKFQKPVPDSENKTQCKGCKVKFFDKDRMA